MLHSNGQAAPGRLLKAVTPTSAQAADAGWPEPLNVAAFHGIAGRLVREIDPYTESDPAAILIQFLVAFGNAVGRGPHFSAEADRHHCNLFAVMVGKTAKGRKGTSWGQARRIIEMADETWPARIASGMSSGEGLIWGVRDPITKSEPVKDKDKKIVGYEETTIDPGESDKRLLCYESEFGLVLRAMEREGNRLSGVIRDAWDRGDLRTLTKTSPARATGAHISIVGHVTADELLRYLADVEAANGFANRFLWVCVKRSKVIPESKALPAGLLVPLADEVKAAVDFAMSAAEIGRDEAARAVWCKVYPALSEGQPGLFGAVTGRSEPQVMRLAVIYALLDRSKVVRPEHLNAALAIWEYCEKSARYIFGDRIGDPVADRIIEALREGPRTRTEISNMFGRNYPAARIETALSTLKTAGRAASHYDDTGGRPAERWALLV